MTDIRNSRILIMATHGYERSELRYPHLELSRRGATVEIAAPEAGDIRSWDEKDWGDSASADREIASVSADDYDALVLPGGQINPDVLRLDEAAVALVRAFVAQGKVVAAVCHGPWLLVEADALRGREATSYWSIRTDLRNAGARWVDKAVVADQGIVTSRCPDDLPAFVDKIEEELREGLHHRRAA
ncbi:type 1 glutamine amidotransferase [Paroceanicella profunda]|uniref:Type 1 glutamine amidotransferase n=1 Tax=Paroceanicella profunda TaxID=2579971 RepID=A0A5B8G0W8_9RHOB|nr:type 1 glutamine amidotransferase domain-containing protein [Paroceanicella profunda]QDL92692.1 type 1 glutamine amidotransferase [Paroceanicella profunda]